MSKPIDDHVYYNALFNNNTTRPAHAYFTETRTSPIIKKTALYHMAVIRFTIPTQGLPLFLWPRNTNGTPNNNLWSFTFEYGATIYRSYLTYNAWQPTTPDVIPSIFNYQNFLDICNTALYNGFIYMVANAVGYPGIRPPYFILDSATHVISLIADTNYLCQSVSSPTIKIYAEVGLHNFFESIPHILVNYSTVDGRDALFVIEPTGNNNVSTNNPIGVYAATAAYAMPTQYPVLQNWSSLKSIVLTSSGLRTKEEYIQTPQSINTDASQQIITDFEPDRTTPGYNRTWLQYQPNIYRYIDINSTDELRSVDISIYWTDLDGNIYPLLIPPGMYFSVKILFTLKGQLH